MINAKLDKALLGEFEEATREVLLEELGLFQGQGLRSFGFHGFSESTPEERINQYLIVAATTRTIRHNYTS